MGVTIESQNSFIDMGYGGFIELRKKVAELTSEDIFLHYKKLEEGMCLFGKEKQQFFEEYNSKIEMLSKEHNGEKDGILRFLYAPGVGAEISVDDCKEIYKVIKDYDDNVCYGYCGRKDCALFKDFKSIVKECIDNNCNMEWF